MTTSRVTLDSIASLPFVSANQFRLWRILEMNAPATMKIPPTNK